MTQPTAIPTAPQLNDGETLGEPVQKLAPLSQESTSQQLNDGETLGNPVPAPQTPEEKASQIRMSAVAGMTGMPTPNMSSEDKDVFEKGKAAGAVSNAAVIGAGAGGAALDAVLPAVLPHTVEGIKAIGAWAEKHPVQAYMLYNVVKELLPGAKKAIGLAKALPTGE